MNDVTEITVQKVWPPFDTAKPWKDGKRRGKVVSSEGQNYHVAETMLREFGVGEVCKVEFKEFGDKASPGKEIIKKLWTGDSKHMAPGHVSVPPSIIHTRQATNPKDSENMLVSVLLKEPRFDDWPTSQIVQLILKHREAARLSVNPQRADDMNDEIPNWEPVKSENPES